MYSNLDTPFFTGRTGGGGQPLTFYCDVERNIGVKCRCGLLHFTLDDVIFFYVNNLSVIRIIGEIYCKMIRFSGNENLIV